MRISALLLFAPLLTGLAHADFSYSLTRKTTGGMMASMAGSGGAGVSHVLLKGQKMKIDGSSLVSIVDFDNETLTSINTARKTYTVQAFTDIAKQASKAGVEMNIDAKETGRKKSIGGMNARELVIDLDMDAAQQSSPLGKMRIEMSMWISSDVPGVQEVIAFYKKNGDRFPWSAMGAGANPAMEQAMANVQKKMASMDGIPVEQIIKMKAAAVPAGAAPSPACAKLEAIKAQGGPMADMIAKQASRLGCGGAAPTDSLLEMTLTSGDFSSAPIPDSAFAIPEGFKKAN